MTSNERSEEWRRKIEIARNVPIDQVIAGQGYTITGRGKILSTAEHDSMKIYPASNSYYRFSTKQGGTPIDFLINECGYDQKDAIELLADKGGYIETENRTPMIQRQQKVQEEAVPFIMPKKAENNKRVYAYLSSRGLNGEIIHDFIKRGLLYESADKHNCVFVGRDEKGNVKAGYMRGTYTLGTKQYKGNVPGSDKQYGIFHEGQEGSTELFCFEAPIDLMSHIQLTKISAHRLALCGLDDTSMRNVLEKHPEIGKIYFCLDADERGQEAAQTLGKKYARMGFKTFSVVLPAKKDWNEYLQQEVSKTNPVNLAK